MSDAPERIWMDPITRTYTDDNYCETDVEYVRADRIEALEAKALEAHLQSIASMGQAAEAHAAQLKAEAERDALAEKLAAALTKAAEDVRQWGSLLCGSEDVTDEVASDILNLIPDAGASFDRAIAEAVQAEREACARVAEALDPEKPTNYQHRRENIPAAIRARTEGEG